MTASHHGSAWMKKKTITTKTNKQNLTQNEDMQNLVCKVLQKGLLLWGLRTGMFKAATHSKS